VTLEPIASAFQVCSNQTGNVLHNMACTYHQSGQPGQSKSEAVGYGIGHSGAPVLIAMIVIIVLIAMMTRGSRKSAASR
jgi:hypothetical protein